MTSLRDLEMAATPGPWHRHTYGHRDIAQIVKVLGKALRNGEWRSTDASYVHAEGDDGEGPSVAFTGNGPKQTNNAAFIAAARNAMPLFLRLEDAARTLSDSKRGFAAKMVYPGGMAIDHSSWTVGVAEFDALDAVLTELDAQQGEK